ncbi:2-oxoacid dehydrogenases acyltransferase-domain-containing protein [Pilobolus umbonatus]|nr:2-oxoacid dehydrogenases acyltransferase-domain-containing protein [Pilobolus umbonatus]
MCIHPLTPLWFQENSYSASWKMPSVRRLLDEYQIDIKDLKGSGKRNLVLKKDILGHIKQLSLKKVPMKVSIVNTRPILPVFLTREETVTSSHDSSVPFHTNDKSVPLTTMQKAMYKSMTKSLDIPHLGYKDEMILNGMTEYRSSLNQFISGSNYPFKKISYLPILIKSLSMSLLIHPILNATHIDNQIQYRPDHNIGIAMDTPNGLMVPNIKQVQNKSILEIAMDLHRLSTASAHSREDLTGGTVTLSNIGSIGGTYANPILVTGELVIIALGSIQKLPRWDQDRWVSRSILPVSYSADHRVIDGATIAHFGNTWKSFIENPALISSQLH